MPSAEGIRRCSSGPLLEARRDHSIDGTSSFRGPANFLPPFMQKEKSKNLWLLATVSRAPMCLHLWGLVVAESRRTE
jgi:hypothetical protein